MAGQLVTVSEAAAELRLSRTTVYQLLARGELASIRIGRSRRITRAAIDGFIRAREGAMGLASA